MRIERFKDQSVLAEACADVIMAALGAAIAARDRALFVATGGRTPGAAYDRLSRADLDWSKVMVTLSDERWVDSSSPDSNERLVRDRLLRGPASKARFIPLKGVGALPEAAAKAASKRLAPLDPPDMLLLGMGDDGHIASLFPNNPALPLGLDPAAPPCIAVPQGEDGQPPPQPRLSLTAPWLLSADQAVILITGEAKIEVAKRALDGEDPHEFPVRTLLNRPGRVRILWSP